MLEDLPVPGVLFHGIDLDDNNTKASLMSLAPFFISKDIEGLAARFQTLEPILRAGIIEALNELNDYTVEILDKIDPINENTPEDWPEEL